MKFVGVCLLLTFSIISRTCAYTLEQVMKESLEKGLESLTQLKRQLPDDMDEDSKELISGDKDYTTSNEGPVAGPTPTRPVTVNNKATAANRPHNCSCKRHKHTQGSSKILGCPKDLNKRDGSGMSHSESTTKEPTGTTMLHPTPTTVSVSKVSAQSNETSLGLQELELQLDAAMREICPHYKEIPDLDIERMADVWQLAYYKSEEPLSCFKIFLKKTSPQSRKRYKIKYTSFNDSIDWHECFLELGSTGRPVDNRRHFLQGTKADRGVLENIVLSQSVEDDNKILTLLDQIPDQWLVTKMLLLMRDCDSGDVVIFTRVPSKPDKIELSKAMTNFGENGMEGIKPCTTDNDDVKVKPHEMVGNGKYNTLS